MGMDELDLAIIDKLTTDARMSFRKIAKDLDVSPDTVISRYQALQKEGVIRGSTIVLNSRRIGYHAMVVFLIDVSPAHISTSQVPPVDSSQILEKLIRMPNIIVATKCVGDHDLLAIGVVTGFEHLTKVKNEMAKMIGVRDIQTSFWVERTELCPKYFII
jgi:Lrp/AsnC family transcriptional regulator, regulator for asnA, asnC and gidA